MFAHIRKFHPQELMKNINREWLADADQGKPLRVWWSKKNDFDEDEETVLYVCLSTDKTFTTGFGCEQHFKKDKAALKDHTKQLKQLKKDFEAHKKATVKAAKMKKVENKKTPYNLRFVEARNRNDPDMARAIWRGILNNKKSCECAMVICKRRGYGSNTSMYVFDNKHRLFEEINFSDFIPLHEKLMTKIETLLQVKCMDVKILEQAYREVLYFWLQNYTESIWGFNEDVTAMHPSHRCPTDELFYNYAAEEMEEVDF
jgi:hypothetical protein